MEIRWCKYIIVQYPNSFFTGECLGGGSEINSGLLHEPDENFVKNGLKIIMLKIFHMKNY